MWNECVCKLEVRRNDGRDPSCARIHTFAMGWAVAAGPTQQPPASASWRILRGSREPNPPKKQIQPCSSLVPFRDIWPFELTYEESPRWWISKVRKAMKRSRKSNSPSDFQTANVSSTITIIFYWFGINVAIQIFLISNYNQPHAGLYWPFVILNAFIRLAVADWQRRQWLQLLSFLQPRSCNEKKQKQRSDEEVEEISLFVLGLRTLERSHP